MRLKKRELKPNVFMQPLQYNQWELIGLINKQADANLVHKKRNSFLWFGKYFVRNIQGTVGICLFLIMLLLTLIIPATTKYDPTIVDLNSRDIPAFSTDHILGTTEKGIDIWAQVWHGARYSLGLATTSSVIVLFIGTILGLMMGYFPKFDKLMSYFIIILQNIPTLPLLIVLVLTYGSSFGIIILVFSLTSWTGLALQVRAQILRGKNLEWVTASKVLGTGNMRIIYSLLPRAMPIIITVMIFSIPSFIIGEITLAVLGLLSTTDASLGVVVNSAIDIIWIDPSKIIIPSLILVLLTTSLLLVGNGIQETLKRTR